MVRTTSQGLVVYESGDPATVIEAGMPTGDSVDAAIGRTGVAGVDAAVAAAIAAVAAAITEQHLLKTRDVLGGDPAFTITDSAGRRSWLEINAAGGLTTRSLDAISAAMAPAVAAAVASAAGLPAVTNTAVSGLAYSVVDANGRRSDLEIGLDGHFTQRVIDYLATRLSTGTPAEVIAGRGSQPTLNARLDRGLSAYGTPRGYAALEWNLRWTRMLTRRLLYGDAGTQLKVALIGDSYTFNKARWSGAFWSGMRAQYGDGGIGYVGFSNLNGTQGVNGSVRSDTSVVETGAWADTYYGTHAPDLGEETSSTAGDKIVITFPAGLSNAAKLFYVGTSDGNVSYQFNGGGTVQSLSLTAGATLQTAALAGITATSTTLTITVVSGTARLCGVYISGVANGVIVSKLGSTGSAALQWATAAVNADWQAGLAALDPDLVVILHGTNDQTGLPTPAVFGSRLQTILTGLAAALGGPTGFDALVVMPAENQRGLAVLMSDLAAAALAVADTNRAGYINLQSLFGDAPADYAFGSARPWYASDLIHPDPATGGRVIADGVLRVVNAH